MLTPNLIPMKKKKSYTLRKFINDVHLWLGLGSGIVLFLVCLSGTILAFEEEIKELFSEKFEVTKGTDKMSLQALTEKLQAEGTVASVTIPNDALEPYEFNIKTSPEDRRGQVFYANPYTGAYQQMQKSAADGFLFTMFKLHRWLLLDTNVGRPIVGIATIIFFFLAISGLVLWFPKKMKWKYFKPGFKIKFSANWKRINNDLHNTLGFYASIFLVIMTLTGLCWSFEWYRDLGTTLLGTPVFGSRGETPVASNENIATADLKSVDEIYAIASKTLNHKGKTSINLPASPNAPYSIRKYNAGSLSPVIADQLIIDQEGKLLKKELFSDKPFNERVASLIKPLHTGQIYGTFSKIIYFLACLIATSLPITGTLIWLNKMKKKPKKEVVVTP